MNSFEKCLQIYIENEIQNPFGKCKFNRKCKHKINMENVNSIQKSICKM